ncbi:MAG: 50S ribosomal protein L23 [Alphaproteobacteria bacterium]|nr:50S ribosomal protein L23 [Alphaproteobacteria bacterium]
MAKAAAKAKAKKAEATVRDYDVLLRPVITEKSTMGGSLNKVTFRVRGDADKNEIKRAVESIFGVQVRKVNTLNVEGKNKRFRGIEGKRSDFKKAVVTLAEGQSIDLAAGA